MDIIQILREKVEALGDEENCSGLRAVILHIETAANHLARGKSQLDDTAYTDAVYRTNQAFEGSIKEAYRVIAGQDPSGQRPYDIENYFQDNAILRPRALSQFTQYRREWRNPSTHDHTLSFNNSEAFLAIVSVCAFANVLVDQIAEKIAYDATQLAITNAPQIAHGAFDSIIDKATFILQEFVKQLPILFDKEMPLSSELIGALHGFIEATSPEFIVEREVSTKDKFTFDLVIREGEHAVVIELKQNSSISSRQMGLFALQASMLFTEYKNGILLILPELGGKTKVETIERNTSIVKIIEPASD